MQAERVRTMTGRLRRFAESRGFCVYRLADEREESIFRPRSEFEYRNKQTLRRRFLLIRRRESVSALVLRNRCYRQCILMGILTGEKGDPFNGDFSGFYSDDKIILLNYIK